jgi:hypothetical protein
VVEVYIFSKEFANRFQSSNNNSSIVIMKNSVKLIVIDYLVLAKAMSCSSRCKSKEETVE